MLRRLVLAEEVTSEKRKSFMYRWIRQRSHCHLAIVHNVYDVNTAYHVWLSDTRTYKH